MTIRPIKGCLWLPSMPLDRSTLPNITTTTIQIDAADEGMAMMIRVPRTGNISKVLWRTTTTTTGATLSLRGETFDETVNPAIPSGTLYHANFTASPVIVNTDDNVVVVSSLAAVVAVTRGDKLAIVIKQPNTSFGNMQIAGFADDVPDFPYILLNTGVSPAVSWSVISGSPVLGLEYDDGTYEHIPGCWPISTITSTAFNNTSTPDEIGNRFMVPFPCRVSCWWAWLDADGDFNVNLYDSDGVTKIAGGSFACDKDTRRAAAADIRRMPFLSTAVLKPNTYYRLVIEPVSATSLTVYDFSVNGVGVMDAFDGGQGIHLTSAKNPAVEEDWSNTLTRRAFLGVGLDGFDFSPARSHFSLGV